MSETETFDDQEYYGSRVRRSIKDQRRAESAALEAGTHTTATDDFGNEYLLRREQPFVVRQFEGTPWVPLHEAARLHDAVQESGLTIAALRNGLASAQQAGLDEARRRLSAAGMHDGKCPEPRKPCTCGLDAAIDSEGGPAWSLPSREELAAVIFGLGYSLIEEDPLDAADLILRDLAGPPAETPRP